MLKCIEDFLKFSRQIDINKPFFEMISTESLILYGENNILDYSCSNIRLNISNVQVNIEGSNLRISYIDINTTEIKGKIENINLKKVM